MPNPVGVRGCDVLGLREWWVRREETGRERERVVAPVCHYGCVGRGDREVVGESAKMGLVVDGKVVHEMEFEDEGEEEEEDWVYDDYIGYGDMCSLDSPAGGGQDVADYLGLL